MAKDLVNFQAYTKNISVENNYPLLGLSSYKHNPDFCVYLGFHAPSDASDRQSIINNTSIDNIPYKNHWLAYADDIYFSEDWINSHHFNSKEQQIDVEEIELSAYSKINIDKYGHIVGLILKTTINSIKWASTSQVTGTWGTTPALGNITLTYTDGTTKSKVYNDSGISLYIDAECTIPFNNDNPGTFDVWAKYTDGTSSWKTTNKKTVTVGKKDLTITKGSSPSSISDGSTGNVIFTTNASATITLTTTSDTGWTAQLTSGAGTSHTIKITNTTGGSAGSIAADAIKVTAVATDTDKYNNITTATGVNTQITLSAPATTYKYYAGVTDKVSFTTSDLTQSTTTKPTTLTFDAAPAGTNNYQTFVYPSSWGKPTAMMAGGLDGKDGWFWGDRAGMTSLPSGYTAAVAQGGAVTYTVTW